MNLRNKANCQGRGPGQQAGASGDARPALPNKANCEGPLAGGGGPSVQNKANRHGAEWVLTTVQKRGYAKNHGPCLCENKAKPGENGVLGKEGAARRALRRRGGICETKPICGPRARVLRIAECGLRDRRRMDESAKQSQFAFPARRQAQPTLQTKVERANKANLSIGRNELNRWCINEL
jgi:hypothetical protein